jgi:hypothetical protein
MDHTDTGLRAVVKSLTDVVAPAVNPGDPLAGEQLRLVVDYVEFVRNRIDFLYDRELFELRHNLGIGRAMRDILARNSGAGAAALTTGLADAECMHLKVGVSIRKLKTTTAALAAAIASVVREAAGMDEPVRRRIERCVLDAMDERIAFDRSWYLPLGFDPAPGEVAKLQDLCGDR